MQNMIKLFFALTLTPIVGIAYAADSWSRDATYKCEDNYTISFHQTEHTNDVVLLKNDTLISTHSKPYQQNVISLDGVFINSTDLSDTSGLEHLSQDEQVRSIVERPNYSFIFEQPSFGKDKPLTGLIISNAGNYQIKKCSLKS